MYKKITLILLILLVIVRSEKVPAKNVTQANFLNLRLSTILPYLSLHNDENLIKDNVKRSLFLLMPSSQTRDEYKKTKETVQKTKRCGTLPRKNRFSSLSKKKEDLTKAEMNTRSLNKNIKIPKQNSSTRTLIKNVKYLQESPANRMKTETHKDNTFLQALKNNMNEENVILNLESRGKTKKCDTENCICYCKEENCFSKSSMKSSSEMLSSSRKDKPEKINHQTPAKYENRKSNILQQISPKLYHKSFQKLRVPNLINSFPARFYQERVRDIPCAILYGKTPNILPYIVENEKKFINIGVPLTSFENRSNFLVKNNGYNQYQPIVHQNLSPCTDVVEKNRIGSPARSTASSSTSSIGATIITQTESDLESIEITEKDQKHFLKLTTETPNNYIDVPINLETEINFYSNYSSDVKESSTIEFSNLNETTYKLEDSTEKINGNQEDNFSKLMSFFKNYVDRSKPSIIYPSIIHNEKLINMKECIKLFGRDVCVLSVTSPEIRAKQTQKNNINEYSTIRIPEYIVQTSNKEGTTMNNVNYSDKHKTIDTYVQSKSFTNGIKISNVGSNGHLESTNTELNVDADKNFPEEFYRYTESIKQTYDPDDNYDENKLFNTKKNMPIPMKKLMNQITDKTIETTRNILLEKNKSHTVESLSSPNNKETTNPTLNINSWSTLGVWNTLRKEEITTISYDFKSGYNFEEESRNFLKESNINIYSEGETSQEHLKEEDTIVNHDSKIRYNFKEEITNRLNESKINSREKQILQGQSEEITTVSYDSKAIYNFEEESMYNLKKLNTDFDSEKEILQEQLDDEIIPISSDTNIEYNFEETTENDLLGTKTTYLEAEILREPVMQSFENEKTNYLNNKEDIRNNFETIIDSSSRRLPYYNNTILLNSIRKVINDFASNTSLIKTKDLDENILQIQGRSLLPEILQIPNIESILSIPQIENTIVEKVKDILSDITVIPKKNFTNESHDVIKNTFRSILQTLSADFHQKLPSMTVEEHQFKDGQWTINSITLAPVSESKLSLANPENLEKSIRNLLNSSTIASQADQYIVRNMIVQSVKNSLTKDEHEEIDNSIIFVLNNILQTLKEDADVLKKKNEFVDNRKDVNLILPQEISTSNYEKGINISNSILIDKQNLDIEKNTKINNEKMQMTNYQKSKGLENNVSMIISNLPDSTEYEKDKSTYIEEETSNKTIYKIEKNVRNQILNEMQKVDMQDNEVKELTEPFKTAVTYHKAISQNNLNVSAISVEPNILIEAEELNKKEQNVFSETTTISSIMTKNFDETEKNIVNLTPRIHDINVNNDNNKSSINHYSLDNQILKYIKNYRINDENVQITTMPTNFIQKTSPNYAQISDGTISENIEKVKDIRDETEYILNKKILTKSPDNSSTNVKYQNEKSKINSSTNEIDPAIILERIEHNLSPIKYYSPEILKYIKSHHNADANDKVAAFTSFMQTSPNYAEMSDDIISQNTTNAKDIGEKIECILNDKISTTTADNVISSLNVDYGNYESKIIPLINKNILDSQQQNFTTKDIIAKIHEATKEVQQIAKTTYLEVKPSTDDSSRISSSSSTCKAYANSNGNKNTNNNNDNDNLIDYKMYNADDITTETNKVSISSSKSYFSDDIYPLQQFPSLIDIAELEKLQLYYISDGIKLPLEIRKLKDDSYALSITKNICEQILEKKCSCCVPLQGHVILLWNKNQDQKDIHVISSQEDMYVKNVKKDYYSTESPSIMITLMTTGKSILKMQKSEEEEEAKEEEEERTNAHYHWKRNLNDNNLTILMPVIEFAKKYNLLLDFNKEKILSKEIGSHDIMQNYDKSLIKSIRKFEYDQLEKRNLNDNFETKKNEFASENKDTTDKLQNSVNFRERKDFISMNFSRSPFSRDFNNLENSVEVEAWKKNVKANQFKIIEDLHKLETEKNIQNINIERKINSKNQKRNPVFKKINTSKDTELKNEEIKSDKYRIAAIEKGDVKVFKKTKERKPQQIIESENQESIPTSKIIISGDKVNMKSKEFNWDKLTDVEEGNVFHKKRKKEHKVYMIDDKQNDSRIKISEEDSKKPYRYQRNANGIVNKRAELVKSMLYWLKGLLLNK